MRIIAVTLPSAVEALTGTAAAFCPLLSPPAASSQASTVGSQLAAAPADAPADAPGLAPCAPVPLPPLVGVSFFAPPVPVVHCVGPLWSQAGGKGSFLARMLVPSGENVGLLHARIWASLVAGMLAPGMRASCT